jgi:hypothetical protein
VWRDSGNSGDACKGCNLNWTYFNTAASFIQAAGPLLNPVNLERAILTGQPRFGTPTQPLVKFGPNDYTALSDIRTVYWNATATSKIDGGRGAYVGIDGGKRYQLGQVPGDNLKKVPVAPE